MKKTVLNLNTHYSALYLSRYLGTEWVYTTLLVGEEAN